MNKRIAIIMTYVNREWQLRRTLETMIKSEHNDWSVIIADDGKELLQISGYPHVHVLPIIGKTWINQLPAYNMALKYAIDKLHPDIIVIQNPECYHVGDVLKYASENVTEGNYLTFSAFSLDKEMTYQNKQDLNAIIESNNHIVKTDGGIGWYNHPVHRPVGYEFCAAISVNNMIMLNGYDERMAYGIAYDDDYMLWRVKTLGLKVEIVERPFVVHQWHEPANEHPDKGKLVAKNLAIFNTLRMQGQFRAEHLITPDL
jgi:glycosyltransferase involved in cell wall biosynthesis